MIRAVLLASLLAATTLGSARAEAPAADPDARARGYFTDTVLVTQDGKEVRFYSDVLKDRIVVINFIFTRCPSACPLLTAKLTRIRDALGDRFGNEVQFVSISVDPAFDTPEELRRFADRNRAAHPGWTFLTGTKASVDLVVKRLGQYAEEIEDHSTTFIAGNVRKAHWAKLRPDLPPEAVVEHLKRLAEPAAAVVPAATGG
jgi:cytochrome oxidase Cu insertion factor (SCO1/SenC/PrrC family)